MIHFLTVASLGEGNWAMTPSRRQNAMDLLYTFWCRWLQLDYVKTHQGHIHARTRKACTITIMSTLFTSLLVSSLWMLRPKIPTEDLSLDTSMDFRESRLPSVLVAVTEFLKNTTFTHCSSPTTPRNVAVFTVRSSCSRHRYCLARWSDRSTQVLTIWPESLDESIAAVCWSRELLTSWPRAHFTIKPSTPLNNVDKSSQCVPVSRQRPPGTRPKHPRHDPPPAAAGSLAGPL